jgi:O-antigen/teichoic acid export membrane protein
MTSAAPVKPRRPHRIVVEGAWVASTTLVGAVAYFLGARLISEWVEPGVWGTVSLLLGVAALLRGLFVSPVLQAVVRLYPDASGRGTLVDLRRVAATILNRTTPALSLLCLIAGALYAAWTGLSYWVFPILCAILMIDARRSLEWEMLSAARRQKAVSLWRAAEMCIRPVLIVAVVAVGGATHVTVMLAAFLCIALPFAAFAPAIRLEGVARPVGPGGAGPASPATTAAGGDLAREVWRYAMPIMPLAVLSWVTSLSDRYILGLTRPAADVGVYAMAYGLGTQPFIIAQAIVEMTLKPVYFNAVSQQRAAAANRVFRLWLAGVAAACAAGVVLFILLGPTIANLLLAQEYRRGAALFPWIAAGAALLALSQVVEKPCYAYKQTRRVLVNQAVGAAACVVAEVALIWKYGLAGAAMAVPVYAGVLLAFASLNTADMYRRLAAEPADPDPDPVAAAAAATATEPSVTPTAE